MKILSLITASAALVAAAGAIDSSYTSGHLGEWLAPAKPSYQEQLAKAFPNDGLAGTWELLLQDDGGEEYLKESGLSLDECAAKAQEVRAKHSQTYCAPHEHKGSN